MDNYSSIIYFLLVVNIQTAVGQLVVLSNCVCPGHELRLQCTVVGRSATVWMRSAFDCPWNELYLLHFQFANGTSDTCNDDRIIGRSINTTSDSDGVKYISQLIIQLDENDTLDGRTVDCAYDNGAYIVTIGTYTIDYSTDPPPPPEKVRLSEVDRNRLDFTWDPVQTTCPDVEYKVTALNCGVCPTATHNTSITCVVDDVRTDVDNLCTLSVQSVFCGVTGGNRSTYTTTHQYLVKDTGSGIALTLGSNLSLAVTLVIISTISITVVVLLSRSRAKASRQLESLRDTTHQRGKVTYEEINLPPVDIDTSKNISYDHVVIL